MAKQPFDKEIMSMTHEFNQPSQQRPRIEMGLYQQRHYQFELKETKKELLNFLDSTESGYRLI